MAEASLVLLILSFVGFVLSRRVLVLYPASQVGLGLASLLLIGELIYRSIAIGFPALTGGYESLLLGIAVLAGVMPILAGRLSTRAPILFAAVSFVAFVGLAILVSPVVSSDLRPPVPILRSAWLVLHVAFAFVGLALFSTGGIAAIVALVSKTAAPKADGIRDTAVAIGFGFYVVGGLVFGAIWAEAAWGRFWGWDPKEIWALITSVVYTVYLHLRYIGRFRASTMRVLAIVCWVLALFTFWGVNALFSGLHSYA